MHSQHSYGKSTKPKKISSRNVNTVNLSLHYNAFANERDTNTLAAKNEAGHVHPTLFPLSAVLGNANHNAMKSSSQRKKERPRSGNLGYASYQATHSSSISNSNQTSSSSLLKSKLLSTNTSNPLGAFTSSYAPSKTKSSVESTEENEKHWRSQDPTKLSKTQVYLPGDRVIFAESPSAPGIPIIYRLEDERNSNPDKLNLDRRKLSICPILEGEEQLRLLNFQHNSIRKIQHLSMLKKLIFLDLYDNELEEISGLASLTLLRVLMLGKNRIKKINNLEEVSMLDVLDLHGNRISTIENISHLHQLRVLNLAGNELTVVKNLAGLDSLSELNLRRNYIHTVHEIDQLPSLQRLFLSFNEIKTFDDVSCLSKTKSLIELSLDGNPFANNAGYKQSVLQNVTTLKQLDMKRLTEEEKRIACVMARKEDERRKEQERLSSIKEKRRLAINNAHREWKRQSRSKHNTAGTDAYSIPAQHSNNETLHSTYSLSPSSSVTSASATFERSSKLSHGIKDFSACHLVEVENDCVCLYGAGSLDALEKNWGEKNTASVISIVFKYISFEHIVPYLPKLSTKFTSLNTIEFTKTNIDTFNDINALASLCQMKNLVISEEGNAVTKLTLWKPYVVFRLTNLKLKTLNGNEITGTDVVHAEKLFGAICHMTTTQLSQTRRLSLVNKQSQVNVTTDNPVVSKNSAKPSSQLGDVCKAGLIYVDSTEEAREEMQERITFATNYIHEIFNTAIMASRKQKLLDSILPQIFSDLVNKYFTEIADVDAYCEDSLEKIKRSVNVTY